MVDRINQTSSASFFDDCAKGLGGNFNLYGVLALIFTRSALQLHANSGVRDRKLPTLRTYTEKYIRMMPDLVRADGLGWAFGRAAGAYGQMHCITLILQGLPRRLDGSPTTRRASTTTSSAGSFTSSSTGTYLDQEHGFLDHLRDDERTAYEKLHTTRMANFDAARYLCQWARLREGRADAGRTGAPKIEPAKTSAALRHLRQEQPQGVGPLFLYRDAPRAELHLQVPLISCSGAPLERRPALPALPRRLRLAEQCLPADPAARADVRRARHPAGLLHGKNCVTRARPAQQLLLPLRAARPDHDPPRKSSARASAA